MYACIFVQSGASHYTLHYRLRSYILGVINIAATWMPNFAIQMKLESKQKEYPTTTYVKDMQKILVEQWGLADDSNDALIFDREGKVVFSVDGQLNPSQIEEMLQTIRKNL